MENDEEDVDWEKYEEPETDDTVQLDSTDYVALFVAALQTVFFPIVILCIFLFCLVLVIRIL